MKRIDIKTTHSIPHFIGCWSIERLSLCDELIDFFESHQKNHTQGQTAGGVNLASKNSTDIAIRPRELERPDHKPVRNYLDALFACHKDYVEQWPFTSRRCTLNAPPWAIHIECWPG
jgi:prolyl 4-hydroxylase